MNLQKLPLTNNNCYKAAGKLNIKGIVVHSTGANNPNLRRYVGPDDGKLGKNAAGNHWNQPKPDGREVCVHAFIGKLADGSIATYQTLPWDMRGWHGGGGPKGSVNDTHISFEICEDSLSDAAYFAQVYQEAVELCAMLCKQYKLDPLKDSVILCHSEAHARGLASNHADVMHWFPKHGKTMDIFRADVDMAIGDTKPPVPAPLYRVRKTWEDIESQKGAFASLEGAKAIADDCGYTVFDEIGKAVYAPATATIATDDELRATIEELKEKLLERNETIETYAAQNNKLLDALKLIHETTNAALDG